MKKTVKAALFAALVCFSSTLFAAEPVSFLKETTFDLFEDETVDNLAWGLEDDEGLVLGGFRTTTSDNKYFNIGAGAWLGGLWYSIYDDGTFKQDKTTTETVKNDVVAKDGVNTDYVDNDKSTTKTHDTSNAIHNDLYLSFSTGDWGIQSYWKIDDTTGGDYGKQTSYTEDKAAGTSRTTETVNKPRNATNTFGAYFKGVGTDSDFFVQLDQFEVKWENNESNSTYSDTFKQNGATYTGDVDGNNIIDWRDYNTREQKTINTTNKITPKIVGTMGIALSDLGSMSTQLLIQEAFDCTLGFNKYNQSRTTVTENFNTKTTEKTSSTSNQKMNFSWNNKITPKFVFDFDVGERLSVKASAGTGIKLSGETNNKAYTGTYTSNTTTYNKITKLTTKNNSKSVSQWSTANEQLEKVFKTELTPETALALVYQVKPEKFNLNVGVQWKPGTFTWKVTTKTNQPVKEPSYGEYIDEAGEKYVTTDSVSWNSRGDGPGTDDVTPETKKTEFDVTQASQPLLKVGATWFITEKASLDITYTNGGFNTLALWNGLMNSNVKLEFAVKF